MSDILRSQFDNSIQAIVDAAGNATAIIDSRKAINWIVSQVSIEMQTAPAGSVCELRKNGSFVTFLISTGDAAGGDPPIILRPSERMTVEWSSCTPGDIGRVYYVYDEVGFY